MNKNFNANRKKNIVAYFDRMNDIHFYKDVGMFPYYLSKIYDSDLIYVTGCKLCNKKSFKKIKVKKIKRFPNYKYNLFFCLYLIFHAKKIDFLTTFHARPYTLLTGRLFKFLNKEGKLIIKMDLGPHNKFFYEDTYKYEKKFYMNIKRFLKKMYRKFKYRNLKCVDLFIVENKSVLSRIIERKYFGYDISNRITYLINGFGSESNNINVKKCIDKKNIILHVSRLGTDQKNSDLLIDIIKELNLKNWCFYLVGPILPQFENKIYNLLELPKLKNKVIILGEIKERDKLFEIYNNSKVFCLTSKYEGFPLVFPEARYFGNYIVTTNVGGAYEITDDNKFGKVVSQNYKENFIKILQDIIDDKLPIKEKINSIIKNRYNITWEYNIKRNLSIQRLFENKK